MPDRKSKLAILSLAGALALGLVTLTLAIRGDPSEAQQDAMHNCPQPGKWAIAVWSGEDGTDMGDALATCGAGAVDVAYYLDPDTQQWLRWFAGRLEISNLSTLDDVQGAMALGGTEAPPTPVLGMPDPASVYCLELGYELRIVDMGGGVAICVFPDGSECEEWSFFEGRCGQSWAQEPSSPQSQEATLHNCPQPGKWAILVWSGQDGTDTGDALATCGEGAVDFAYYIDPDTQAWLRYFVGRVELSNLLTLDDLQGVLVHGAAAPTSTPSA